MTNQKISFQVTLNFGYLFKAQLYRCLYTNSSRIVLLLSVLLIIYSFTVWGTYIQLVLGVILIFSLVFTTPYFIYRRLKRGGIKSVEYHFDAERMQSVSKIESFEIKKSAFKNAKVLKNILFLKAKVGGLMIFLIPQEELSTIVKGLRELGWMKNQSN